jgi:hypothetical protein
MINTADEIGAMIDMTDVWRVEKHFMRDEGDKLT